MFTAYMHPKSRFAKDQLFRAAENVDFLKSWNSFVDTYQELMGYLEGLDYFECCGPVDTSTNGWNIPIASKKGPITEQAGIMFNVCLMHRLESLRAVGITASKIEGRIQKDAQKLIDYLVFERLEGKLWSGSGDSQAAKYIQQFKDHNVKIPKVDEDDWEKLLAQLFWGENAQPARGKSKGVSKTFRSHGPDLGSSKPKRPSTVSQPFCGGRKIGMYSDKGKNTFPESAKIFLIHFYFTLGKTSPQRKWGKIDAKKYQWDHIIPESSLTGSPDLTQNMFCNNTANCCALPQSKNLNKSSKHLNSQWALKHHRIIEIYTEIKKSEQKSYSSARKIEKLCVDRGIKLIDTFLSNRNY